MNKFVNKIAITYCILFALFFGVFFLSAVYAGTLSCSTTTAATCSGMTSQGSNSPGTMADDATVGTVAWSTPDNAKVGSDSNFASATLGGLIVDSEVKIVKSTGAIGATNKAQAVDWPSSGSYFSYGGTTDLWGETWTPADINSANFGVVVSASSTPVSHYLKATNFGFSVPSDATISGISVEIQKQYTGTAPPSVLIGSYVKTPNGDTKIEDLKVGDKVLSYNEATHKTEVDTIVETFDRGQDSRTIYNIYVKGLTEALKVTKDHLVYTNRGFIPSKELKVGDVLLDTGLNDRVITSIDTETKTDEVFDLTTDKNHDFFANNLLVHNIVTSAAVDHIRITVYYTATTGVAILRMSGASNAHAELPGQANVNYAGNVVCCSGVSGLGNSCLGTSGIIAKLSSVTNAHTEQNSQTNYANNACISAPGSVSVGYQASNCIGYDTTVASMSGITNAHVGDANAYTTKICATATAGSLIADIVDSGGTPIVSPAVSMTSTTIGFGCQTSTGTLGTSSEKIRVTNTTGNASWSLSIAGSATTALWTQGVNTFDFNDASGSGCADGADADTKSGQMTQDPFAGTVTPQSGCTNTGVSLGSSSAFSEGITDSITLLSASGSASTGCYWDLTGISLSQSIPAEQNSLTYNMNYVITVVAN